MYYKSKYNIIIIGTLYYIVYMYFAYFIIHIGFFMTVQKHPIAITRIRIIEEFHLMFSNYLDC